MWARPTRYRGRGGTSTVKPPTGRLPDGGLQYPEYKQAAWNYPEGDLSIDQRHRARIWATYGVPRISGLVVSVLQTLETGVPYGAVATTRRESAAVRDQPRVPVAADRRDVLPDTPRRVPDRGTTAHRFRGQLRVQDSGASGRGALRPASGAQRLQPVAALRLRTGGVSERRSGQPRLESTRPCASFSPSTRSPPSRWKGCNGRRDRTSVRR